MKKIEALVQRAMLVMVAVTLLFGAGCATKGQTGAAVGAGTGALVGGLAHGEQQP